MLFENYSDPSPKLTVHPVSSALPKVRPEQSGKLLACQRHLRGGGCGSSGPSHTWRLHKPAKTKDQRSQKELVNSLMTPRRRDLPQVAQLIHGRAGRISQFNTLIPSAFLRLYPAALEYCSKADSAVLLRGLRFSISNQLPGDGDVEGPRTSRSNKGLHQG